MSKEKERCGRIPSGAEATKYVPMEATCQMPIGHDGRHEWNRGDGVCWAWEREAFEFVDPPPHKGNAALDEVLASLRESNGRLYEAMAKDGVNFQVAVALLPMVESLARFILGDRLEEWLIDWEQEQGRLMREAYEGSLERTRFTLE